MTVALPIDDALRDRNLLGAALGKTQSWGTWMVTFRAAFGLPLSEEQQETFARMCEAVSRRWSACCLRDAKWTRDQLGYITDPALSA